jgi:hypothetical protein
MITNNNKKNNASIKNNNQINSVMADAFKKAAVEAGYTNVNQYKQSLNNVLKK